MYISKVLRTSDFDYYGTGRISMVMSGNIPVVLETRTVNMRQNIVLTVRGKILFNERTKVDAPGGMYARNGDAYKLAEFCLEIVNGQGDDFRSHMPKREYYEEIPEAFAGHPGLKIIENIISRYS
jgi:hypothetical protein